MPDLAFVISAWQDWYLREFVETLRYELERQDVPSTLHTDGFPEPRPDLVYVLVAPRDYLAFEGSGALPDEQMLERTIFLCAQSVSAIDLEEDVKLLGRAGAVFDLHGRSVALHRKAGIPARHLRPGYSKLRDGFSAEADRTIDVMFLGAHSLRRTRQLGCCARALAPHNCLLQISDDSHPNPGGSTSFIAEGKWDLLKRTKVVLNIHRGEDNDLEWLRVLDAIHSGAVVVTEHASGMSPFVAGEHLLVASPESLPYVLDGALRDVDRLEEIRSRAYDHLRTWLPFALSVSVFRTAAVEIVGRSISPTASRGVRVPLQPTAWEAGRVTEPELDGMRRELKSMSLELVRLRRELSRFEGLARSGAVAPAEAEVVHETLAWPSRRRARATVVTVLDNRAGATRATLDSVAGSLFRDFELIVVDDGSSDGSADVALEWMEANATVSALLVRHSVSRGLGAGRNTALEYARGRYYLTLDPGDTAYPRCLEVLIGTLDGLPTPAFAYPLLEVYGMPEAFAACGGDYLRNVFGWEASASCAARPSRRWR
ncbi:MAG: glycosyltransferase [Solirubrobacteraceae bacterium]